MLQLRKKALKDLNTRSPKHNADWDKKTLPDVYGTEVLGNAYLESKLHRSSYKAFRQAIETGSPLDPKVADEIASVMKDWAVSKGATHFTHWFQPLTGLTAEKHDSFINFTGSVYNRKLHVEFSGKQLIKGEPDASSFPNGGIRSTFEARGYTAWDMESPAFIRTAANGKFLCIPTAFASWTGEALDLKTPLLRSNEAVGRAAARLFQVLGHKEVTGGYSNDGIEQEFFLVDRSFYLARPDLITCGRTLIGAPPAKGQQMEDHYFGATDRRVLAYIQDCEWRLWQLGVPTTTRHNEVAPSQYEMAPIFESMSVACDHNMLMMEVMKETAREHDFAILFHEKPFAGVNGSGKHNNWSVATNTGVNLFEPGDTPAKNAEFLVALAAVVRAVHLHGDLLRAAIAVPGNDFRLGANEAPPAIMSVYVGDQLAHVIEDIITPGKERAERPASMRLGADCIPPIPKDFSDRNRTSPFAFTGNKFEFRAVGGSQACSRPGTILNTIAAESFTYMADEIEKEAKNSSLEEAIHQVVTRTLKAHHVAVFNGNGYSAEWKDIAQARGLRNLRTAPEGIRELASEKNVKIFEQFKILSRREVESQQATLFENFSKTVSMESECLLHMVSAYIVPTALEYKARLQSTLNDKSPSQANLMNSFNEYLDELLTCIENLKIVREKAHQYPHQSPSEGISMATIAQTLFEEASYWRNQVMEVMSQTRSAADALELIVDDKLWPFPKYSEILLLK